MTCLVPAKHKFITFTSQSLINFTNLIFFSLSLPQVNSSEVSRRMSKAICCNFSFRNIYFFLVPSAMFIFIQQMIFAFVIFRNNVQCDAHKKK